jgi:restriction system protein
VDLLTAIAGEFGIPIIDNNQKSWFFRTKAGQYYYDFRTNGYIALGWDLVSPAMIRDKMSGSDWKKEQIEKQYPDEKRPGLILGQLDTFYNKMQPGDIVVIPSEESRKVAIGKIGDVADEIVREKGAGDYPRCNYRHKRLVEWIKEVESWQDIYLFKAFRGNQTISDLTGDARLVLRNLYPVYILGDWIHLTLQKKTDSELSLADNVDLLSGILEMADQTSELYSAASFRQNIQLKTAVGSPGIIEMIAPYIPVSLISVGLLAKFLMGKAKAEDGSVVTGVLAVITKINDMINDSHGRGKTDAETRLLDAQAKRTDAEARRIDAEARLMDAQAQKTRAEALLLKTQAKKTEAEIHGIELENQKFEMMVAGKTAKQAPVRVPARNESLVCAKEEMAETKALMIAQKGEKVCAAALRSEISFDGRKVEGEADDGERKIG